MDGIENTTTTTLEIGEGEDIGVREKEASYINVMNGSQEGAMDEEVGRNTPSRTLNVKNSLNSPLN